MSEDRLIVTIALSCIAAATIAIGYVMQQFEHDDVVCRTHYFQMSVTHVFAPSYCVNYNDTVKDSVAFVRDLK